jgi:hypothetical protein
MDGGVGTGGVAGSDADGGSGGSPAGGLNLSWDFSTDAEGWTGGFADYPSGQEVFYQLAFGQATLPAEVGPGGGLRMEGNNHSDDLFMFVTREIDGLRPNATYLATITAVIDTNAPSDCGGIGGTPGPNVYVKMGAVSHAVAVSADSSGFMQINLDKGNQSVGGADMKAVGDLGNTNLCPDADYQPKTFSLAGFSVSSDAGGSVRLILGTDSGYEGLTILYYDRIALTLQPQP